MNENTQPKELTAKQAKAIEALLTSPSIEKAAQSVGINKATLHRWLREPVFNEAFRAAKETLIESTLTGLQAISALAVETLHDVLDNPNARSAEKVSAARAVLDFTLKTTEALDTQKAIAELQAQLELLKPALTPEDEKRGKRR